MKSAKTLFAAASLLAASGVWAAEPSSSPFDQFYVGIRGGAARSSMDSANLTASLRERGHQVTATVDDSDIFGGAYLGYRFHPNAGIELGYVHAGKYEASISGSPSSPQQLADDVAELQAGSGNGVALDLRFDVPVAQQVDITTRIGAYAWKTQVEVSSSGSTIKSDERGVGGHLGLGLTVKLPAHFRLGFGYELLIPTASHTIGAVHAQLEYGFGQGRRSLF